MTAHDLQSEGVREQIGTANPLQSIGQALDPTPVATPMGATGTNKDGRTELAWWGELGSAQFGTRGGGKGSITTSAAMVDLAGGVGTRVGGGVGPLAGDGGTSPPYERDPT